MKNQKDLSFSQSVKKRFEFLLPTQHVHPSFFKKYFLELKSCSTKNQKTEAVNLHFLIKSYYLSEADMASKHKFSKKTWLGICFLGFFFLVGLGSDLTYSKPDKQALEKENTTPKKEPLTYEITRKDSSSHIDRGLEIKRVTYDAVPNVQEPPSEGTIRNIADQILKNDPEVWHETTVFIRLPGTVKKHPAYASVVYELGGHRGTTVFGTENLVCSPWNDKLALDDPLCKEYLQD